MAQKKNKPTAKARRSGFIINLLTLIVLVLLIFEGKSLISLFSHVDLQSKIQEEEAEVFASANLDTAKEADSVSQNDTEQNKTSESDSSESEKESITETETETDKSASVSNDQARVIGLPADVDQYLECIVPAQAKTVSDSYFADAVFIGDSRMEGFRNFSGISGSNFVTAVGMELENFYTDAQIATAKGSVTCLDALKNMNFSKIYMMIGTNELGAYSMEAVRTSYEQVLKDVKLCASVPDPTVYVFSVIYVDEYLTETDYVNNTNVDLVNTEILKMCQENGYHYINLNEVLSDGNHSLISGASEDGVHLNQAYCQQWLEYTKLHYLPSV